MANIPDIEYDFFIAHAGPSTERARELYDCLVKIPFPEELHSFLPGHPRVFLDSISLAPGDKWPTKLAEAQAASAITIALVCDHLQSAYYAQEEVAAGISFERNWGAHRHIIVPTYLDGFPDDPTKIPYGLRCRHGIDVPKVGWVEPTAIQLWALRTKQPAQDAVAPILPAHPLHLYPCGPMVEFHLVSKALIQDYAQVIYPYEAFKVIDEANALRISAGGCEPDDMVSIIQRSHLPPPSTNSPMEFWQPAFTEACKHGPRMLAALLLVVPDGMFQPKSKTNRKELLESTLRTAHI